MTDVQPEITEAVPVLLERGRYAITGMPDGSWVIARAAPICDTCQGCGCGEQADPIHLPQMIVNMMTMSPEQREKINPLSMMRKLMGGRNGG